jgi:hypothetical protein
MITGDSVLNGVYTLGRYGTNYPLVLDMTYPISARSGGSFVLDGIEIGSITVSGSDVLVSWYDHNTSTYGVDIIDWDNKLSGAYLETTLKPVYRTSFATYTKFTVAYDDLPTGTAIDINYSKDYGTTWVTTDEVTDTQRGLVYAIESAEATLVQMKIIATTSVNDAPVIESASIKIS